jgi:YD repeat-containing protein
MSRWLQSTEDLRTGGIGPNPIDTSNIFNPTGQITVTSVYDANGRLTSLTDNNKNITQYTCDALNRRTAEVLVDMTSTIYGYDANDNVIKRTDNNGTVANNAYDAVNRRTQTTVVLAPGVIGTTANTYQYDGLNRVRQATDNNNPVDSNSASTITFVYDSLSRIVEETQNGLAVDGAWFAQAQRTALTYPNGRQLSFTYDSLERIQTIQDNGVPPSTPTLAQYTYIGAERILQRQYQQNGTQLTYLDNAGITDIGYDPLRRTVERRDVVTSTNSTVVGFQYAYDRENNKHYEAKLHSAANSELYTYDSTYRVTQFQPGQLNATNTAIVTPSLIEPTEAWTLDGVDN